LRKRLEIGLRKLQGGGRPASTIRPTGDCGARVVPATTTGAGSDGDGAITATTASTPASSCPSQPGANREVPSRFFPTGHDGHLQARWASCRPQQQSTLSPDSARAAPDPSTRIKSDSRAATKRTTTA